MRHGFLSNSNLNINLSLIDPGRGEKFNLNFYFHTSLCYLKRFYEGFMFYSLTVFNCFTYFHFYMFIGISNTIK